jgi:hypothetical protein
VIVVCADTCHYDMGERTVTTTWVNGICRANRSVEQLELGRPLRTKVERVPLGEDGTH